MILTRFERWGHRIRNFGQDLITIVVIIGFLAIGLWAMKSAAEYVSDHVGHVEAAK